MLLVIFGRYQVVVNNFVCKSMLNRVLSIVLSLFLWIPFSGVGQVPNSWIDFSQSYYKIPVSKNGIYKVTYSDLQAAGFPVGSVDPRRIQIFHRGIEQSIFIQGQTDAVLNPTDYLEFYGKRNDGTRDALLYKPSSLQPHPYYNIYSDTAAYFLTWNFTVQGKRMEKFEEVNVSNLPKETFHNQEKLNVITDQYSGGYTQSDVLQYTQFDQGEGWTGIALRQGQVADYVLDVLNNTVQSAGLPELEVLLAGRDNISHSAEIYIGPSAGSLRLIASQDFFGFAAWKVSQSINWTDIGTDGKMLVRIGATGSGTQRNQLSASYLRVKFPQSFDVTSATEKTIHLKTNSANKSYIELDNPSAGLRIWDVTDPNNVLLIGAQASGNRLSAVVGNTQITRTLYASASTVSPGIIKPVLFRQIDPAIHNYLIITHRSLMKPASGYGNVVEAYAGYRASQDGGSYDTLVVTTDQLYNQFNYGETSSLAIYEFVKFMVNGGTPRYLFLIGKGRDAYAHRIAELSPSELNDLVPTAGVPSSDMAFSAGLKGTTYEPALPTGRLTASQPEQVAAYLNKVKETEMLFSAPTANHWHKKGLHLSGGINLGEPAYFRSVVDSYKSTAEGIYWGGSIQTIAKSDPRGVLLQNGVKFINIAEEVNKGLNLITFFGHSSPVTSDVDIGKVTDPVLGYNNPGKYPVLLINGCNAGNTSANGIAFGEDWIMAANKGARNFIAHSSYGFVNTLQGYSDLFYRIGFADSTFSKKGIGDVQKEVARRYMELNAANLPNITQVQQMLLLGDPALRLLGTTKSDYETNDNSVYLESIDGNPVTALSDSFAVKAIVKNFGIASGKPLEIRLTRKYSDGTSVVYDSIFPSPFFQDTLTFKLYKEPQDGSGTNEFYVLLDPENKIQEISKSNNTGKLIITIPSNGTKNLYPLPYAIVSQQTVNFLFQDTDLLSTKRDFQIEIDTISSFNSPYVKKLKVTGVVLAKLSQSLLSQDSLVYYWRTRFDQPEVGESKDWVTTSFTFINNGQEGWAQSKGDQLAESKFTELINDPVKGLAFTGLSSDVFIRTFGSNNPTPYTSVSVKINNAEYNLGTQSQPCRNNTINLIAFNRKNTVPYAGIPFNFQDPRTCGREPQLINSFTLSEMETGNGDDLLTYVDNISVSDSVLIFSIGDPGYPSWSTNLKNKLAEFGIAPTDLSSLQQGEPLIIFGRKGASSGTANVFTAAVSPKQDQELQVNKSVTGRATAGRMKSTLIGPAKSWRQLKTNAAHVELNDVYNFSFYGVRTNGTDSLIKKDIAKDFDLSVVSGSQFPYARVELTMNDEVNLTPVQLKNWLVLYEPVAEGLLLHVGEPEPAAVQEGAPWSDQFKFVNISNKIFSDSLTAHVDIFNTSKLQREDQKLLIKAPAIGDSTIFVVSMNTKGKVGLNDLSVSINPKIVAEQYYDNNSISLKNYIQVVPDRILPLLDVSIDGRYIRNFDYVLPNPLIVAVLKDENPFLYKMDTVGVNIFLRSPCGTNNCDFVRINFSSREVKWFPATATSDFRIEYRPQTLADSLYTLKVEATDASGNASDTEPYQVTFQVKNETTFELKSVFPNPSTHYFFFQFQLTGNVLPDYFSLQIFTTDGRLVQQFGIDDIADFNFGLNEFSWQANDLAGNLLPNGMYIYRMKIGANSLEINQQGKLVLSH